VAEGFAKAAARRDLDLDLNLGSMTVLDVGAGTGLVGELVRCGGVGRIFVTGHAGQGG